MIINILKLNSSKIRFLYNLLFPFVLIILLPGFLIRMFRRGKYRHKFAQRFALYSPSVRERLAASQTSIWVHAVSVGEVLIALKLIKNLCKEDPTQNFVLSTTTSTGFALANKENIKQIEVIYNPIDFYWTIRQAVQIIRPKQLILVEAEVWPNLVLETKRLGASIVLVNARLSPRSEKYYQTFHPLTGPLFRNLDAICLQEPSDVHRWTLLGAEPNQLHLTGSIKFDDAKENDQPIRDFRPLLLSLGCPADARIILAGSTHSGEEKILGKIFLSIRNNLSNTFLLVAPRHMERAHEVVEELRQRGLNAILRSTEKPSVSGIVDCIVIDSTGELRDWYCCADAVFIGKSLTSQGGQNPAEAIVAGKPVTFGPNMQNFQAFTDMLLSEKAAIVSHNEEELEKNLLRMLTDQPWVATLCKNASNCVARHRGATQRTIQILRKFL